METSRPLSETRSCLIALFLSLVASWIAVSSQSLWIDEANSAFKAIQPDFDSFTTALVHGNGSDLQMPLYMSWLWIWARMFGASEWTLRAANLPWFFLAQMALLTGLRNRPRLALIAALLAAINPLVWAYLNEARPYLMQYAAACWIAVAIYQSVLDKKWLLESKHLWILAAALYVVSGSSLLGVPFAGTSVLALLYLYIAGDQTSTWKRSLLVPILAAFVLMAVLGFYYFWTFRQGARASAAGLTDWRNFIFAGYELTGFSGLGPGRQAIREMGFAAFRPFLVVLIPSAIIILSALGQALFQLFGSITRRSTIAWGLYLIPPLLFIFGLGIFSGFRVLGRHFMPVEPALILFLASGIIQGCADRHWLARLLAILLFAVWLGSALSLRFAVRHAKDDYRSTAKAVRKALAQEKGIWWAADIMAARYYGLPAYANAASQLLSLNNPTPETLESLPQPDLIVLSKPDIFDPHNAIQHYILAGRYQPMQSFTAFVIYARP